jgi:hypothetical protein
MRPGRNLEDRAWAGYDPRAAAPAAACATGLSAAILAGRWAFDDLSGLADRVGAFAFYVTVLAVWPVVLGLAAYRSVVRTYRLTDRAVLIDWGPFARPEPPVWLTELAGVRAGVRWFGVGWVELVLTGGRRVRLRGVYDPRGFADRVRALATASPAPPPP